jgi:type IV pilus assembly protein PilW
VALAVAGILLGLLLPIVLSNRRVVQLDQARTSANQTLRAAQQLLGSDVRIAGERFGEGLALSPIELSVSGDDSVVTLRRNLEDALPVCEALSSGDTSILVADWDGSTGEPQCAVNRTVDVGGTEWPATLAAHRQLAEDAGGSLRAFLFDPSTRTGQWFEMTVPTGSSQPDSVSCASDCAWDASANYGPVSESYVAILETIVYRLNDGVLERVDVSSGEVLRIASGIASFDVTATFADGSTATELASDADWREIASLELDVRVERREGESLADRSLQTRLFPRNVLSR